MTETIARRMLVTAGYTDEERRIARLWLMQRRMWPGDSRMLERMVDEGPLQVPIGEVIRWRQSGRSA